MKYLNSGSYFIYVLTITLITGTVMFMLTAKFGSIALLWILLIFNHILFILNWFYFSKSLITKVQFITLILFYVSGILIPTFFQLINASEFGKF